MNTLIEAYKNTKYKIFEPALTIEIGKINQEIDDLLNEHKSHEWAFITAYNPFSKVVSEEENIIRHIELKELTRSYKTFEGHGVGDDPSWEPELSLFVMMHQKLGLNLNKMRLFMVRLTMRLDY